MNRAAPHREAQHPDDAPRRRWVAGHAGVALAVSEYGPIDAPGWLLAHGAGSSARFLAAAFAGPVLAAGARLITYDLRGHGASAPARTAAEHHLDVQADDLLRVADTTSGPIVVLGGVSLGAHMAVRAMTARSPATVDVEVVAACLPAWTGRAREGTGPHAAVADEVRAIGIRAVIERIRATEGMPAWLHATLLADYPRHDPASLTATLEALEGGEAPTEAELAGSRAPLAVVGWDDDPGHPIAVARRWAELAPTGVVGELRLHDLDAGVDVLGRRAVETVTAARTAG